MNQPTSETVEASVLPQMGLVALSTRQIRGKPGFIALIKANEAMIREIAIEMEELMENCKVKTVPITLRANRNPKAKTLHLRWTYRNRHCTWDALEKVRESLTAPIRHHFELIHKRVLELNSLAVIAQTAINQSERQIGKRVSARAKPKQW